MPFITVKMIEGRTPEQKRTIVEGVTTVVAEACGIVKDRVHVFIEEISPDSYARGGILFSEMTSNPPAKRG
jgi:4-oxalocrotonate tautomerase